MQANSSQTQEAVQEAPGNVFGLSNEALYDLRGHQSKAMNKLSNGKILWGGVGTGKSRVAACYYHKYEAPKRVYVITTAKKRDSFDWQEEFYRIGIGPATGPSGPKLATQRRKTRGSEAGPSGPRSEEPSGLLLEGDREGHGGCSEAFGTAGIYPWVLTVDSWNNIAKYADVAGAFFIFDEQRLVGSGDWSRKFLRIAKRNNWILLSGTPGDTWMDYIPVFVANNFYKNRTHFKREHVVYNTFTKFPKVDRYIGVNKLHHLRSKLLVEMPYERHTRRRVVEVPLKYDKEALEMVLKKRWHIYENRPLRDIAEMFLVGRRLVNSDPSRLEMVKELWQNHPKLIVFYNFNYELDSLRSLGLTQPPAFTTSSNLGSKKALLASRSSASAAVQTSAILRRESERTTSTTSTTTSGSTFQRDDPRWRATTYGNSTGSSSKNSQGTRSSHGNGPLFSTASRPFDTFADSKLSLSKSKPTELDTSRPSADTAPHGVSSTNQSSVGIAEWNGHKHEDIPKTDRWIYLVQYTAGAEGWNCIETDAMIMFSRNYSWKVYEQAQGRIDRLNSPFSDLWYYDFTSDSFIDRAIGRSLKAKQTFQEIKYKGLFDLAG